MRKTESQKIALCGVLSALSVVVLLVGNVLQIGTYAAPMLASFLLIPVLEDYGKKYALLLYAVVSLLSLFLVPDKELVLFYVLVLGYYPVLRARLNNIRRGVLRWMAKFGCFNAAVVPGNGGALRHRNYPHPSTDTEGQSVRGGLRWRCLHLDPCCVAEPSVSLLG